MEKNQIDAIKYYNAFSKVYDIFSPKWYYHNARNYAIQQLQLKPGQTVLNLPCGTGQNFEYFQNYLKGTGLVIGIDLSEGMLEKAKEKKEGNDWQNIQIYQGDATQINTNWIEKNGTTPVKVDAILCDLGLSGFPNWKIVVDNMLELIKPNGILVIMDWYIPTPTLRGKFIKWIGGGEVNRPIYQYLETKVADFSVDTSFNRGGVFVATGIKN